MMWEVEAEQTRGLADVMALHEQTFGLVDYIIVDVANGCSAGGFVDEVAKVARGISQFRGTIGNGWQAVRQLTVLAEIGLQQVVEALQQVNFSPILFGELSLVNAVTIFQNQAQISQQYTSE